MIVFFNEHTDVFIESDKQAIIQYVLKNIKWLEHKEPYIIENYNN